MAELTIGRLERVNLRTVWPHEASDFTPWLQDNLEVLNEVIDLDLVDAEREQAAGSFSVDLVAQDSSGNTVVVENQLGRSDHDHLGKVITYLTAWDAKAAIWIVGEPRPEHVEAVNWLNQSTACDFYLIKAEAVRIADSAPAPLLTLIVGPSSEARAVGLKKKEIRESANRYLDFWTELLSKAKDRTRLHSGVSPVRQGWVAAGAGKTGLGFNYVILKKSSRVELYIDTGDRDANKAIFDGLAEHTEAIHRTFGSHLDWQRLDARRASRIAFHITDGGGLSDHEDWPAIQARLIDAMVRFEKALKKAIRALP